MHPGDSGGIQAFKRDNWRAEKTRAKTTGQGERLLITQKINNSGKT